MHELPLEILKTAFKTPYLRIIYNTSQIYNDKKI